jgi:hypothetical protein
MFKKDKNNKKSIKKENDEIKNNKKKADEYQNSSGVLMNVDSKQKNEIQNINYKKYNNRYKKMPSILKLNKSDKNQSKNFIDNRKFFGVLNAEQLKRKSAIIRQNNNSMILDYLNLEYEQTNQEKQLDKTTKTLFPTYYYFMDILIDKFIKPKYFFCINKKYLIVYNFMGQIFDIRSHIILVRNFNILQNIFFQEINGGKKHSFDKRININNDNLMDEINYDLNNNTCDIFTKVLLT